MSLYQLIYQSKESSQLSNKDFSDILDVARQNNANLGVTGCLFYNGGWVLQVLEGEQGISSRSINVFFLNGPWA